MCLVVDFGKVVCLSANELQRNSNASSRENYIPQILEDETIQEKFQVTWKPWLKTDFANLRFLELWERRSMSINLNYPRVNLK